MWAKVSNNDSYADYLVRMHKSPQFSTIGVEPLWVPDTNDIHGYIHDEIIRQFHNPRVESDGGRRIKQMHNAWDYAQSQSQHGLPSLDNIHQVAHLMEPDENSPTKWRQHQVQIGGNLGEDYHNLPTIMGEWHQHLQNVSLCGPECENPGNHQKTNYFETSGFGHNHPTPDDVYHRFQKIHPLGDGNGRTGKVLLNWMLTSVNHPKYGLHNPYLPPDYFGGNNP